MVGRLTRYVLARIGISIPLLFVLLIFFFIVTRILPGDPAVWMAGERARPEDIEAIRTRLGLDRPMHIQLVDYFSALLRLDLGRSLASGRFVTDELAGAYPATIELSLAGTFFALLLGIPTGILGALRKGGIIDQLLRSVHVSIMSVPVFWLGMILQMTLAVNLGFFPVAGRLDTLVNIQKITGMAVLDSILTLNGAGLVSSISHIFLPALTLGLTMFPLISRISRAAMIAELSEDYIATAKAKGCSESSIVYKYALRNAMIPVITMIGLGFVGLVGGAVLTESVFSLPGIGRLLVTAAFSRDYPLLQGCVLVIALVILAGTTLLDIIYAALDPRVKL